MLENRLSGARQAAAVCGAKIKAALQVGRNHGINRTVGQ
jgi:hypothetical protein